MASVASHVWVFPSLHSLHKGGRSSTLFPERIGRCVQLGWGLNLAFQSQRNSAGDSIQSMPKGVFRWSKMMLLQTTRLLPCCKTGVWFGSSTLTWNHLRPQASLLALQWRIRLQRRRRGFAHWVRKLPWWKARPPTPAFLPGESQRQRSLAGYSPWGRKELHATEAT